MKTTIDLPAELVRSIKIRAVQEGRKFKEVAAELLRLGLAQPKASPSSASRRRVKLPLIRCQHPASPDATLTPERVAGALLAQEVDWTHETARR